MLEIETPRNYQKIDEDSSQIQINPLKVVIESKLKKDNKSCQFSENFFFNHSKTEKSRSGMQEGRDADGRETRK